jgi:hypothetical protein
MNVSLSIWHRNVHGIYQSLSWISLNANKLVFVSLLFSFDFSAIQTVLLFLPHPVYVYLIPAKQVSKVLLYVIQR